MPTARLTGSFFALPLLFTIVALEAIDAPTAAASDVAPILLGEVSASGSHDVADATSLMRGAAQRELTEIGNGGAKATRRIIVSLALVKVETRAMPAGASVECSVSATLRTAKDGALFAILEGRARAEGGGSRDALESEALRAAVKGTIARIPSALR